MRMIAIGPTSPIRVPRPIQIAPDLGVTTWKPTEAIPAPPRRQPIAARYQRRRSRCNAASACWISAARWASKAVRAGGIVSSTSGPLSQHFPQHPTDRPGDDGTHPRDPDRRERHAAKPCRSGGADRTGDPTGDGPARRTRSHPIALCPPTVEEAGDPAERRPDDREEVPLGEPGDEVPDEDHRQLKRGTDVEGTEEGCLVHRGSG